MTKITRGNPFVKQFSVANGGETLSSEFPYGAEDHILGAGSRNRAPPSRKLTKDFKVLPDEGEKEPTIPKVLAKG